MSIMDEIADAALQAMSIMDEIADAARANQAVFAAGATAANAVNPAARKLSRLLAALDAHPFGQGCFACKCARCLEVNAAIEEAKQP